MKLPFSYRQSFFAPVLGAVSLSHAALFVHMGFFAPVPQFGIKHGLASVEVVIIKESEEKPVAEDPTRVLTALESSSDTPAVLQKKEAPEKLRAEESVYIPPSQGAAHEAKPEYLKNPAPIYPLIARQRGWEGVVILSVVVNESGKPTRVTVRQSSGFDVLDEAAVEAVKRWIFSPAHIGNIKLQSQVKIPIRFSLRD